MSWWEKCGLRASSQAPWIPESIEWAKMPRSVRIDRTLLYVKLFCCTGISMFIIIIIIIIKIRYDRIG
jgi:hypothetical protein